MKYLPLIEVNIKLTKEKGSYIGSAHYWEDKAKGAYIANDGIIDHFVIWDGAGCMTFTAPVSLMLNTEPAKDYDKLEDIYKQLVDIKHQLQKPRETKGSGIDSDTLIRALAVAQKPDLIKDM